MPQSDFFKHQVPILVYIRINQSDTTLLCDVTNEMQLYYMTHVFMVQDRGQGIHTRVAIVVWAVVFFFLI